MHEIAQTATETELAQVRPSLKALLVGLPITLKLVSVVYGATAGGLNSLSEIGSDPMTAVLLTPVLIGLHRDGQAETLMDVTAALEPQLAVAEELVSASRRVSPREMESNLLNQPPEVAETARRLLTDSPFDDIEAVLSRQADDTIDQRAPERRDT
jgi:hypothetical protein